MRTDSLHLRRNARAFLAGFIAWLMFWTLFNLTSKVFGEEKTAVTIQVIHPINKYSEQRKWVIKIYRVFKSRFESQITGVDLKLASYKPVKMRSSWNSQPIDPTVENSFIKEVDRKMNLFEGYTAKLPDNFLIQWFLLPSKLPTSGGAANGVCTATGKKWRSVLYTYGSKWIYSQGVHLDDPAIGSALHEFGHAFGAVHDVVNFDSVMSPNAGENDRFFLGKFVPRFSQASIDQINNCLRR